MFLPSVPGRVKSGAYSPMERAATALPADAAATPLRRICLLEKSLIGFSVDRPQASVNHALE